MRRLRSASMRLSRKGYKMYDPKDIQKDFPMFRDRPLMQGHPLVWLDNASTTFKPDSVIEEVVDYYSKETSNSHRGDYDLCFVMDEKVLHTRQILAKFLNCSPKEVVFTSGATASLNTVAYGYGLKFLKPEDEILITEAEHASNVLPWFQIAKVTGCKVKFIPLSETGRITPENLEKALTPHTKLVSFAAVGNVLGYVEPVKELTAIAHKAGALVCLDGAQSVPHGKTDVKDLDIDFLAFSGHKMLGPTGIGVLYGKYDLLCQMDPFVSGGGNNDKFHSDCSVTFLPPPEKFEAGTLNLAGILGLGKAVEYLNNLGFDQIEAHERKLKNYAVLKLKETGNAVIYNEDAEAGIVTFNINGVFAQDGATYLNSKGIACRSGQHCAKLLNQTYLDTPATIRASFYIYTTTEDIDALSEAVKTGGNYLDAYFI